MNILAFGIPGGYEIWLILFASSFGIIPAIPFWNICSKAGYPAPLGLLMLVPMANIVLPLYLAFSEWPALGNKVSSSSEQT
jgi:hypothetical protein